MERGEIAGAFFFREGSDPTYLKIDGGKWQSDAPYGVIHRIPSSAGGKGVAAFCLD